MTPAASLPVMPTVPRCRRAPTHHHSLSLLLQDERESPHLTPAGHGQLSQSLQVRVRAWRWQCRQERNGGVGSLECPRLASVLL